MAKPDEQAPISARLRDAIEVVNTPFRFVQDALRFPISEGRRWRLIQESLRVRPAPLIVYSAPKTASTSVATAIEATDAFTVMKVHHVQPEHFWPGVGCTLTTPAGALRHKAIEQRTTREFLRRYVGPVRIVSLMRDPIAFNVSNFTYFGRSYWLRTAWRSARWMPEEELARRFFEGFPHESSSVWWRSEFAKTIGVDVLERPFDQEQGWLTLRSGRFDVLVLRTDLDDAAKSAALRAWLPEAGVPDVRRLNQNDAQAPPELADRLREAIARRPDYVDRMLDLPASRYFWSERQRAAMRERWLRPART